MSGVPGDWISGHELWLELGRSSKVAGGKSVRMGGHG